MEISFRMKANGDYYLNSLRDIAEPYQFSRILKDTYTGLIADYQEISPEICRIVYDTGHIVTVNRGNGMFEDILPHSVTISQHGKVIFSQQHIEEAIPCTTENSH